MIHKIISVFLFCLLFSGLTGHCFADVSVQFQQADAYMQDGYYQQAKDIYQAIVTDYPGTDDALSAYKGLAMSNIALNNYTAADAAVGTLTTEYSQHANAAKVVNEIGHQYRKFNKYEKAKEVFNDVLNNWSSDSYTVWSHMGLAMSEISLGNQTVADTAIANLLAQFPSHVKTPRAVYAVAGYCRGRTIHQKADEFYQTVISNWPGSKFAALSQKNLAISKINLGKDAMAEARIEQLTTNYSQHENAPRMVHKIAHHWLKQGKHLKAIQAFQKIVDIWPSSEYAISAQKKLAMSNVALGDDTAVDAAVAKLVTDFSGHSELSQSVFRVGARYYDKALDLEKEGNSSQSQENLQKAVTVWEKITKQLPESARGAKVYNLLGECHRRLGQHQKAIDCYEEIVSKWPGDEYAWNAQFLIGYGYKQLRDTGSIPRGEANTKIKTAYQKVLENYPNCPAAKAASNWLNR